MPGAITKKKNLYLGKCLDDLHKKSEVKQLHNSVNIIIKSADTVFRDAKKVDNEGDEEKAFVLFMKYFNILTQVKSKPDYKKQRQYFDKLMGPKNQKQAIERAESLTESLKDRYDLQEAELLASKLSPVDGPGQEEPPKVPKVSAEKDDTKQEVNEKEPSPNSVSCTQLCDLLRDSDTKILIIDTRPSSDFSQSHISHTECINIPEDNITPGSIVSRITAKLSSESKAIFDTRKNVDHIILMDWRSKMENVKLGTALQTLKDALYKFDTSVVIKSEPLVLEGGYQSWLVFYPTLTTNAHVAVPDHGSGNDRTPSPTLTLDFDYPELDEYLQKKTKPQPVQNNNTTLAENGRVAPNPLVPTIDRSLKPSSSSKNHPGGMTVQSDLVHNTQNIGPPYDTLSPPDAQNTVYLSLGPMSKDINIKNQLNLDPADISVIKNTNGPKPINLSIKNNLAKVTDGVGRTQGSEVEDILNNGKLRQERESVEEVERKLKELELLKKKKERDVADLLRKERKIKEEQESNRLRLKQEEKERLLAAEEEKRKASLLQAQKHEEEKRNRMMDIEKMRAERKKQEDDRLREKEEDELRIIQAEKEALNIREEQKERERELQRIEELKRIEEEEEERIAEEMELLEKAKVAKAEKLKKEVERQQEIKRLEEKRQREIKEGQMEAARKDEEERKKKELMKLQANEEARKARERAEQTRLSEMSNKERSADQYVERSVPTTNLPKGWEKRLNRDTNRYYYIDHNTGQTTWQAPTPTAAVKDTYTTKLKDDKSTLSRGMSRSHSSPNIMKELEEEEKALAKRPGVMVDRSNKPLPVASNRIKQPIKQPMYSMRKRDLTPIYGNVIRGLTGLRNLGNTCYMNSTIQCLSNTSPLITYILEEYYHDHINRENAQGMHGEVVDDFSIVIKALWSGQYRSITPRDLKSVIGKYNPMFAGYQQQDSQEFLTFLLDGLHEGLNEVKKSPDIPEQNNDGLHDRKAAEIAWEHHKLLHRSIIVELFQGQLKSTLMCRTCRKTSVTFQAFMFLSLPIPASSRCSLKECIQEFLKPEMMTGSSKWKCPNCKVERDSEKKIDIWKLPCILLVGLNRFYSEGMWMQKKTTYVDFPISDVDLSPYTLGPPPRSRYNLYGMSNHYGTMEGGHYTAICRNPETKKWYKFDDQDVHEISKSDIKTSAAFVLYYTSIEMQPPRYKIGV